MHSSRVLLATIVLAFASLSLSAQATPAKAPVKSDQDAMKSTDAMAKHDEMTALKNCEKKGAMMDEK